MDRLTAKRVDVAARRVDARHASVRPDAPRMALHEFVKAAWPVVEPGVEYHDGWHIERICTHLEAVAAGKIRNLLLCVPPRHMKSLAVSVFFPCWLWTWRPFAKMLYASYAASLSVRDSVRSRRLLDSPWYRSKWGDVFHLAGDQNLKSRFDNNQGGFRIATGIGGAITGEGADYLVVDDGNNVGESESEVIREGTNEWFDLVWATRRNDPKRSAMVIIQQRSHERDLAGHVLARGGWESLVLPCEYDGRRSVTSLGDNDPRTVEGDLLWPARFGRPEVDELKKNLGLYGQAGQLQQLPSPRGGGLFKRANFEVIDAAPPNLWGFCRGWDLAASADGCRTAGVRWARDDEFYYLLGCVAGQWLPHERDRIILQTAQTDGPETRILLEQEGGSGGIAQIEGLTRLLAGYAVEPIRPTGDKITRADAMASQAGIRRIKIVRGDWVEDYLAELEAFPNGRFCDRVDASSLGFNVVVKWAARRFGPSVDERHRQSEYASDGPRIEDRDHPSWSPMKELMDDLRPVGRPENLMEGYR